MCDWARRGRERIRKQWSFIVMTSTVSSGLLKWSMHRGEVRDLVSSLELLGRAGIS